LFCAGGSILKDNIILGFLFKIKANGYYFG